MDRTRSSRSSSARPASSAAASPSAYGSPSSPPSARTWLGGRRSRRAAAAVPDPREPPMSIESRDGSALEWSEQVARADGYVLVTPEHNHGYPAPLKNALDHLFSEWNRKP